MTQFLWFDSRPNVPLVSKICRGARCFQRKHGQLPTACVVNPAMINAAGGFPTVTGIRVSGSNTVDNCFFLFSGEVKA